MGAGRKCKVHYREKTIIYNSMRQTVLKVIQEICKNQSISYKELKEKLPDEIADCGGKFTKDIFVIKKEADLEDGKEIRFFCNEPIFLEKDGFNIVVSGEWNKDNFAEFARAVYEEFNIKIDF